MKMPIIKEEAASVVGVVSCLKSIPGVRPWTVGGQAMLPASKQYTNTLGMTTKFYEKSSELCNANKNFVQGNLPYPKHS